MMVLFQKQLFRQRSSSLPPGEAAAQIKRIEEENGTKKSKIAEEVNISLHIGDHSNEMLMIGVATVKIQTE